MHSQAKFQKYIIIFEIMQIAKQILIFVFLFLTIYVGAQDSLSHIKNKSGILLELDKSEYRSYNSYYYQSIEFNNNGNKIKSIEGIKPFLHLTLIIF